VGGTESVVAVAQELGAAVALISTDAVFDGTKGSPYVEGDERNPISVYGRTKVEAENRVRELEKHYVFRVSVLFGRDKLDFVSKGLVEIDAGREYRVPSDQIGSATYVDDASSTMLEVLRKTAYGTFHICNAGVCSRYDIAVLACDLAGLDVGKVVGVPLVKMNRPGPRVPYSVMETGELRRRGFGELRDWKAAMAEYLTAIQGNKFFRS
jgi:dTDP-4-dehydrorhamnose reductase